MKNIKKILIVLFALIWTLLFVGCGTDTIFEAAEKGDLQAVQTALAKDPDIMNKLSISQCNLLHHAAKGGRNDIILLLLQHGFPIEGRTGLKHNGLTVLEMAARDGRTETVALLLEKGALPDPKRPNKSKYFSALYMAAYDGYIDVVRLLLQHGADISGKDKDVLNPILPAIFSNNDEVVKFLLEHGAVLRLDNQNKNTLLHYAVSQNNETIVRLLLEKGAAVNAVNSIGRTPLHYLYYWRKDHPEITKLLLEYGADVNIISNDKSTPLHYAAFNRFHQSAVLLLKKGAEVHYTDDRNRTPLALAIEQGAYLVGNEILVLHLAAQKGDHETFARLLKLYPQLINSRDLDGKTPLHVAAAADRLEIAKLLLDNGADLNLESSFKSTPLVHGIVGQLLVPNIGRIKRSYDIKTALAFAVRNQHEQMAQLLKSRGATE